MTSAEVREIELVGLAVNGSREAFDALVRMHAAVIFNLCFRLTGDHANAQDLSQEAFIKAFKNIRSFKQNASFSAWVYRITVNLWLNVKRKNKGVTLLPIDRVMSSADGDTTAKELPDNKHIPEADIEKKELENVVSHSLSMLSPEKRLCVVLRYIEGKSLDEMKDICGCSIGTISSRTTRGLAEMKETLKTYTEDTHNKSRKPE